VILHRPLDPLQYCRDLLGQKLAERGGTEFRPEVVTDWLRNCYTEATTLVDEHGIIHGKAVEKAPANLSEKVIELNKKVEGIQKLLDASTTIATLDPLQATSNIITETCRILECDRATIFTIDSYTKELKLSVAEGATDIRIPIGQGIAGTVALTGETINISDAYSDPRFSSASDKQSGYRTTTILCMPIFALNGNIIGVLQAINKKETTFNTVDEEVMGMLAIQAAQALQNANLYSQAERNRDRFRSLLDIVRAMQSEMGVNSLIFTITQRTIRVVDADRCTLYLVDNVHRALFSMQGEVNIRISMDQGIAGSVASTGQLLNIVDAYENPHFNQAIDKKSGYRTKAILCMPIKADDQVVGVLQLINKMTDSRIFTEEDEDTMATFLAIAGPILAASSLYASIQGKGKSRSVSEKEMPGSVSRSDQSSRQNNSLPGFQEGDEEGDEHDDDDDEADGKGDD